MVHSKMEIATVAACGTLSGVSPLTWSGTASVKIPVQAATQAVCARPTAATPRPHNLADDVCVTPAGHWDWVWRNHRRVRVGRTGPCLIHCSPGRR
jgi:hypothetical protein